MFKKILLIVLLLPSYLFAEESSEDYAILSDALEVKLVFEQCSRMTPTFRTGYRELTNEEVLNVEALLPEAIGKSALINGIKEPINLEDYHRQYVGFELLRRELVYINAIHKEKVKKWAGSDQERIKLIENWRSKAISVCGGEDSYWGAMYDAQSNVITEVLFNTPAKKK